MLKEFVNKIKNNVYSYFILKLFIFSSLVVVLDFVIGNTLNYLYFNQKSGVEYRTAYAIDTTTADLLIFGTSRANHQYYPEVFKKGLNVSYYNAGRDGTSIFYHYAVLKGVLKRHSPKIVILDFEFDAFRNMQDSYDRLACLLPYYKSHPEIRSILELRSPYEKLKLLSRIYPFNSSILTILAGNSKLYKNMSTDIDGYLPLPKIWTKPITTESIQVETEIDSNKIKTYEYFIRDCVNSNIELYIVCPPSFINRSYQNHSVILGKEIAENNRVKFLDYTNDSIFLSNASLYADIIHFNDEGAKLFSNFVVSRIVAEREGKAHADY